ncbi:hypothetical protein [Nannocystis pusilla]|uniref:hypothetical protein n=1 Tax=Nannocystis pusilla TaxID=889268 RepID=UPI003B7ADD24
MRSGPSVSATSTSSSPREQAQPVRNGVVIAYSHRERDLLGELQVHLKPLQKAWMLDLWDDLRVAGAAHELRRALAGARVTVLLISPGFLASAFITEHRLPAVLAAQQHPRAAVQCLYMRPAMDAFVEYQFADPNGLQPKSVRISSFYGLNDPMKPLAAFDRRGRAEILAAAADEIIRAAHRAPVMSVGA